MWPWDWFNPFSKLGSEAARVVTDAWIAMWLSVWNAGLWLLRLVLSWMDAWLTPDLSGDGPGHDLYVTTFWVAGVLVVILLMVQIGVTVLRRDGRELGQAMLGLGQFVMVVVAWLSYTVTVTAAAGGLTKACMESLLNVTAWREWQPFGSGEGINAQTVTDGGTAVILGLLGLLVWLAAIGHLVIILARDATLMVLVATGPIAAAGLPNKTTRAWFWKTFRWFHAAAFTPLLVVIVTGVGMKFAAGVSAGAASGPEASIGTAVPAVILILISVVAPLALFKLLAFVDPGTASGAAMRAGMAAMGGVQGLFGGNPTAGATAGSSTAAGANSGSGGSSGEASADEVTTSKAAGAAQALAGLAGGVGMVYAAGIGAVLRAGSMGASVISDVSNQEGVGNSSYQPDYSSDGRRDPAARAHREANSTADNSGDDPGSSPERALPDTGPSAPSNSDGDEGGRGAGGGGGGKVSAGRSGGSGAGAGGISAGEAAEVAAVAL